jgi:hypothetical protein
VIFLRRVIEASRSSSAAPSCPSPKTVGSADIAEHHDTACTRAGTRVVFVNAGFLVASRLRHRRPSNLAERWLVPRSFAIPTMSWPMNTLTRTLGHDAATLLVDQLSQSPFSFLARPQERR